ncbi:hypothetical protein FA822_21160 [Escherichia coli]|nr:hypothetical protein [Escherichia coli]EFD4960430.1 hypothetical protein [Escherichia coli]
MKRKLIMCAVFFCSSVNAGYRHFIFEMASPIIIDSGTININDDTTSVTLNVTGGLNGAHLGVPVLAQCSGLNWTEAYMTKTSWLILPKEVNVGGAIAQTEILSENTWRPPLQQIPDGYTGKIIQSGQNTVLGQCWTLGQATEVDFFWKNAKVKVTVPKQSISPGVYNINIPFHYGYEEHKTASGDSAPDADIPSKIIGSSGSKGNINVTVNVVSKCNFNSSQIDLTHDRMSGQSSNGNQTRPHNFNITCTPGTSLSLKLSGVERISGKTDNYTRCGSGGMCELTFDDGKYDETMTIDNSKTFSIKSTYHLNDIKKPVAEYFEGSGVLRILIN